MLPEELPPGDDYEEELEISMFGRKPVRGEVEYQESDDGVIFIPRHGHTTRYGPSCTQYQENLLAAWMLGARVVLGMSAVGSLQEKINTRHVVIPDDYVDEKGMSDNIWGEGLVVHTAPGPAFDHRLRRMLMLSGLDYQIDGTMVFHDEGTYVTIPGDRFGTAAEGRKRSQYADIVGMNCSPEAAMAMQMGLHYALAAFVVDSDHDANHEGATLEVMKWFSDPKRVPRYISMVINNAKRYAQELKLLPQLEGNIIFNGDMDDLNRIENPNLRRVAEEIVETYCE